jgi:hypothetical protein
MKQKASITISLMLFLVLLCSACQTTIQTYDKAIDTSLVTADNSNVMLINSAITVFQSLTGNKIEDSDVTASHLLVEEGYLNLAPSDPWDSNRSYKIVNGKAKALGMPSE